ncbi:MAG: NADPH-dependent FMN reductase [Micromonosporaceae bacterium]
MSGHPRLGSRTAALAVDVGRAVAARRGDPEPAVVDVSRLGADLLIADAPGTAAALDQLRGADLLVVATPTYKGAYTGLLKVLFDHLPARALDGRAALTVVTAGAAAQATAAEGHLQDLLGELGARVARPGLTVVESDLADAAEIAVRYATAASVA